MPTIVSGSIPPNKSDLEKFGVYRESNATGKFLNLFWSRINSPSGTVDMDFERARIAMMKALIRLQVATRARIRS